MFEKKSITGNLSYPVCICREDLNIQAQRRPILGMGLIAENMTLEHTLIHSDPQSILQVKSVVLFPIIAPPMAVLSDSNCQIANSEVVCKHSAIACQECTVFVKSRIQTCDTNND